MATEITYSVLALLCYYWLLNPAVGVIR